jgi:hypothetical protein
VIPEEAQHYLFSERRVRDAMTPAASRHLSLAQRQALSRSPVPPRDACLACREGLCRRVLCAIAFVIWL